MSLPSPQLIAERAFAYSVDFAGYQTFAQGLRDQYFLNAWENEHAPRMGRTGLNVMDQIVPHLVPIDNATRIHDHIEALQNHAPLTFFDPYLTLVVAIRESGQDRIMSRRRRLEIPRSQIQRCRESNGTDSGGSRPCMGECRGIAEGTLRPVTCYDTWWRGGLDNLGAALSGWRGRNLIPPGYDSGSGQWEVGWEWRSGEGSGGITVWPGFVPQGEMLIAYAIKLFEVSELLITRVSAESIIATPLNQLDTFFRRFLLQVAFGGPGGSTSIRSSTLDCDAVIAARPVNPTCTAEDGSVRNEGPYIERHFTAPWRSGIPCSEIPALNYGISTVLVYLRDLALANGATAPVSLLDLQRTFTDHYRQIYCRIALRRFQVGIVRAIEAATLERTRIFEPVSP